MPEPLRIVKSEPLTIVSQEQPAVGAHPEAVMHAPTETEPVTLGELRDNPVEAMGRIATIMKTTATDPKTWYGLAAAYFGPKVLNASAPTLSNLMNATMRVGRATGSAALEASPDVVGVFSPRAAHGLRIAQRIGRAAMTEAPPPETPPVSAPAPAQTPTAAQASPEPAAPTRTPAKPSTPIPQGVAIKQAVDAFADVKTMPLGGEVSNAAAFVQRGFSPAEAVAKVLAKRPAVPQSAAEALAQRLGTPSDTAVAQSVLERNATGRWKK